ncbi:type II toxin-antitoxin system RelE/ParE family toxin [Sphingomonas sp. LT1P40]|uniref:type II toxin-antitoxin system RelE/ParE family toxin n=1 Tax=Alteristakelama amylovorans TaxID=3096166 RepID=UPI002FC5CB3D
MAKWRLARTAADDLVDIYLNGLGRFGLSQADHYHGGLESTFEFLAQYPRAARLREEITPPVRAHRYKAHLIVYEIDVEDTVFILRIRHAREDWTNDAD